MPALKSLQALRAVAALLVVMYHAESVFHAKTGVRPFYGLFGDGSRGVDLFFVLSGFIIAYIHARDWDQPSRSANYLYNRFSRIYPSVWVMTFFALPLYALGFGGGTDKGTKLTIDNVITSAFLLPQKTVALVNVTWTLKYEIFFYLIFTFLILNRRVGAAVLILWQCAVVYVTISGVAYQQTWLGFYLRPICIEFGMGMICALIIIRRKDWVGVAPALPAISLAAGIAVFLGCALIETFPAGHGHALPDALFGISASLIVLSLVILESAGRLDISRALVRLGDASYAIYLVHFSVISLLVGLLSKLLHGHVPLPALVALIIAAIALYAGLVFDRFVDRPLQLLLREAKPGILRRLTGAPALRKAD